MGRGLAVGVCACVLALAAASSCGGSSGSSTGDGLPTGETLPDGGNGVPMRTRIGTTERELDLVGPSEYVPAGVVAPFRAATGCDVQVTTPASSREMLEMVRTGGYDGVVAPSEVSGRLIASHDVAPIDTSLIPDFDDLSTKLQSPQANTLNGVHYGVSYLWGANPLLYRTDLVTPAPQSWDVVFDGVSYPGRVTAPDTPMYIADAALYLKSAQPALDISDPYELTQPQFDAAVELLRQQRAQINRYWSSSVGLVRDFTSGEVVLGQAGEAAVRLARGRRGAGCDGDPRRGRDRLDRVVDDELPGVASGLHAQVDGLHRHPDRAGRGALARPSRRRRTRRPAWPSIERRPGTARSRAPSLRTWTA